MDDTWRQMDPVCIKACCRGGGKDTAAAQEPTLSQRIYFKVHIYQRMWSSSSGRLEGEGGWVVGG